MSPRQPRCLGPSCCFETDGLALQNGTITLRERDTTSQLIGKIDDVIAVVDELVKGTLTWEGAGEKLEAYSGVQDVE